MKNFIDFFNDNQKKQLIDIFKLINSDKKYLDIVKKRWGNENNNLLNLVIKEILLELIKIKEEKEEYLECSFLLNFYKNLIKIRN